MTSRVVIDAVQYCVPGCFQLASSVYNFRALFAFLAMVERNRYLSAAFLLTVPGLLLSLVLFGCGTSQTLQKEALQGKTIAVTAAMPEPPIVYHEGLAALNVRPYAPYGERPRGTLMQEFRNAQRLEMVLQAGVEGRSPATQVAARLGKAAAEALDMQLVSDVEQADVVLDVKVFGHGMHMPSWRAGAAFFIDADVTLVNQADGKELWSYTYDQERRRADVPYPTINRITGEELGNRFLDHADMVVDRITRRLTRAIS